ncbi:MAG: hypothetical protein ABGW82_08650 [Paracoccus sp. (in: a-proteobacteria)]
MSWDFEEEDRDWPLPMADRRSLFDPQPWREAQADCAFALAQAGLAAGRLESRLTPMTGPARAGALRRLALLEAEAMLWAQGSPLARHEIDLDLMAARAGTDLDAMAQARWAVRRLEGQGDPADLRGFLGLHRAEGVDAPEAPLGRLSGRAFDHAAEGFLAAVRGLEPLHPLARAPALRLLWRLYDLSPENAPIEAAVWIARRMAADCPGLPFLPMGRAGQPADEGPPKHRLRRHLAALADGASAALAHLDRVAAWSARAGVETEAIKGSNAARIVAALAAHPLMSTAMVEESCATSRDTAERLLARLERMGLVREATGTRRFRLWAAAI